MFSATEIASSAGIVASAVLSFSFPILPGEELGDKQVCVLRQVDVRASRQKTPVPFWFSSVATFKMYSARRCLSLSGTCSVSMRLSRSFPDFSVLMAGRNASIRRQLGNCGKQ